MTILVVFVMGMVLTIPPPAFHRISLIFPIIVLIISVTVFDFYLLMAKSRKKTALFVLTVLTLAILVSNMAHFQKILAKDGPDDPDYPKIQRYLEQRNENTLFIAAFETYGMGGILFIRSGGTIKSKTTRLENLPEIIPPDKISYLVILYPDEEKIGMVKKNFPKSETIGYYQKHALLKIN
jgi:hypothetical protein